MANRTGERMMLTIPFDLSGLIRDRAKAGYRTPSNQVVMLLRQALAAEKTASEPTA